MTYLCCFQLTYSTKYQANPYEFSPIMRWWPSIIINRHLRLFFLSCNFHTCHLRSFFIQVLNSTLVFSSLNAWFEIWYLGSSSNVVYVCNTRYIQLCKRRKTQSLLSESTIWNSYRAAVLLSAALPLMLKCMCCLYNSEWIAFYIYPYYTYIIFKLQWIICRGSKNQKIPIGLGNFF